MTPTPEQQAIAALPFKPESLTVVNAFAGTGKTSTLELVSKTHAGRKILYLCYNKALEMEARSRFPRNVTCRTIHALALKHEGRKYQGKKIGGMRTKEIMAAMGIRLPWMAVHISRTVGRFLQSDDTEIREEHLPRGVRPSDRQNLLASACKLWERMKDPQDSEVFLPHDGYLKTFALSGAEIGDYDMILLDEAQDSNPVTAQVVFGQRAKGKAVVLVGDRHQGIYGWRGAVNSLETALKMPGCVEMALTGSFRMTPPTADRASRFLAEFKGETRRIVGHRAEGRRETRAVVARSNGFLISDAYQTIEDGMKVHFAGTSERDGYNPRSIYDFDDIEGVYHLWKNSPEKVRSPYLKMFRDFGEIEEFCGGDAQERTGQDMELKKLVEFVKEHQNQTLRVIDRVCSSATSAEQADLTVTTAHRSKGLEWDEVALCDDFFEVNGAAEEDLAAAGEELNLLYVAMTRAKVETFLNQDLEKWDSLSLRTLHNESRLRVVSPEAGLKP